MSDNQVFTTSVITPAMATDGIRKRTVSDFIRHLFPGQPFISLISVGKTSTEEMSVRQKDLIGKRSVMGSKFEAFTWTPTAVLFAVVDGGNGTTTFQVPSVDGMVLKRCLVNTNNKTVARIGAINTSTKVVTVTSVGDATFTTETGDEILLQGPAYEEKSSSPYILQKDPANNYNFTQIMRFPVGMSRTAMQNPYYGPDRWKSYKEENMLSGFRLATHSLFFSERASGTNEKTTDGTLSDTFRTMRGLWNWAQTTYDAGGNLTFDKFMTELPLFFHNSVSPSDKKILTIGTMVWAEILSWINEGLIVKQNDSGTYKQYGVESTTLLTAKGPVDVIILDAFDQGAYKSAGLVWNPNRLDYVYLKGDDLKPKPKQIQDNDEDGVIEEIMGEISIAPDDGGYSITTLTNLI